MKIGMETTAAAFERGRTLKSDKACPEDNPFQKQLINTIRSAAPKVPYGYLAKDGVITYNDVQFICDQKTNSICLGDVSDPKKVINIPLSGGGHLKVNRENLGQLSKAIGMFSPEDVNLILRAIHLDTRLQSVQKEVEDLEAGVGEQIADGESQSAGYQCGRRPGGADRCFGGAAALYGRGTVCAFHCHGCLFFPDVRAEPDCGQTDPAL